jgi:predicted ABC-type ATPase
VNRPSIFLIGGANGSGKSTLTICNPDIFASFPTLDPDAAAKAVRPTVIASSANMAGGPRFDRYGGFTRI